MPAADLLRESLIDMAAAGRLIPRPGGGHVSRWAVARWVSKGVKARGGVVRLEAVRAGGRWMTSVQAVARFLDAQTEAAAGPAPAPPPKTRTPAQARRAHLKADAELQALGL